MSQPAESKPGEPAVRRAIPCSSKKLPMLSIRHRSVLILSWMTTNRDLNMHDRFMTEHAPGQHRPGLHARTLREACDLLRGDFAGDHGAEQLAMLAVEPRHPHLL